MKKVRRHDIYFYVAVGLLLALVGLSAWYRTHEAELSVKAQRAIHALQVLFLLCVVVLFCLSFRQPLKRMRRSLFASAQEAERTRRRKKKRKR